MYSYTGAELTETTLELNRSTLAGGGSGRRGHPLQQGMVVTAADDKGTHNSRAAAAADNEGTQNSRAVAAVYNEVTLREQVQRVAQVHLRRRQSRYGELCQALRACLARVTIWLPSLGRHPRRA